MTEETTPYRAGRPVRAAGLVYALLSAALFTGADSAIRVIHSPPREAHEGTELRLEATLSGAGARTGEIYYRASGGTYQVATMHQEGDHWAGSIPGDAIHPPAIEYYLRMETEDGEERTEPSPNPDTNPFSIPVAPSHGRVVVLSPPPGGTVNEESPEILALFEPPLSTTDGVLVLLDRHDVTALAEIAPDYLLLTPFEPLAPGEHEMRVFYPIESGTMTESRWTFIVGGLEAVPRELSGHVEIGWGTVLASTDSSGTPLPYAERSGLLLNVNGYGTLGARELSLVISRNPIYESETRWSARLAGPRDLVEVGDVLPYLSDDALAWLAADGAWLEFRRGVTLSRVAALRTESAGVANGLASYDQYLVGGSETLEMGRFRTTLTGVHTFDRESSLPRYAVTGPFGPEGPPFIPAPIANTVWVVEEQVGNYRQSLHAAFAWSDDRTDDVERRARSYRIGVARNDARTEVALEFRSRGPGYLARGAPAIESGEEGFFLDTRIRPISPWSAFLHLEVYRDYESSKPLEHGEPIVQASLNVDSGGARARWLFTPFFIARIYRVPYSSGAYRNDYSSAGTQIGRGRLTGSVSLSYTRTSSAEISRLWTGNGLLWYRPAGERMDFKLRARIDRGRNDRGSEDYDRPGLGAEMGYRWYGTEVRGSYDWLNRRDQIHPSAGYTEHLLSLTLARTF